MNRTRILHWIVTLFLVMAAVPSAVAQLRVPEEFESLQLAIEAATDGDVILLSAGTYSGPGFSNIDTEKRLFLVGVAGADKTFIALAPEDYGISTKAPLQLTGITFEGGRRMVTGRGNLSIQGCRFQNSVEPSTAVRSEWRPVSISASAFTGNEGGALSLDCPAVIRDTSFVDNQSDRGGAFLSGRSSTWFHNCAFESNMATRSGGATETLGMTVYLSCKMVGNESAGEGGAMTVARHLYQPEGLYPPFLLGWTYCEDVVFEENRGASGGAVHSSMGSDFRSCRFAGNSASSGTGGALYGPGLNLFECEVVENVASVDAGSDGEALGGGAFGGGLVQGCLIANNIAQGDALARGAGLCGSFEVSDSTIASNLAQATSDPTSSDRVFGAGVAGLKKYSKIKLHRSIVSGNCPNDIDLELGEFDIAQCVLNADGLQSSSPFPALQVPLNVFGSPFFCGPLDPLAGPALLLGFPTCQQAGSTGMPAKFFDLQEVSPAIPSNNIYGVWIGSRRSTCPLIDDVLPTYKEPWDVVEGNFPFHANFAFPHAGEWHLELISLESGDRFTVFSGFESGGSRRLQLGERARSRWASAGTYLAVATCGDLRLQQKIFLPRRR